MLRGLLGAVLLAFVCAAPARAGGTLTPVGGPTVAGWQVVAGPSFAGEGLAWGRPTDFRDSYDLTVLRDGRRTIQHVPGPGPGVELHQAFAASADAVAISLDVEACAPRPSDCGAKGGPYLESIGSHVFAGRIGQPLDSELCGSRLPSVDVDGTVVAYDSACSEGTVVRDITASSDTPYRVFPPAGGRVRLAGRYLALYASSGIVAYDWQTGDVVHRADGPRYSSFDVNANGVLALTNESGVYLESPHETTPRRIAAGAVAEVQLGGSRVALRSYNRLRVLDLDGTEVASASAGEYAGDFDFDGSRLVYATQPCEETAIVTWDLEGDPPRMPAGLCPSARLAGKRATVNLSKRTFTVAVRCPATPALGCSGYWGVDLVRATALRPGERRDIRMKLTRGVTCAFARHRIKSLGVHLGADSTLRDAAKARPARVKRFRIVGRAGAACRRASARDRSP